MRGAGAWYRVEVEFYSPLDGAGIVALTVGRLLRRCLYLSSISIVRVTARAAGGREYSIADPENT